MNSPKAAYHIGVIRNDHTGISENQVRSTGVFSHRRNGKVLSDGVLESVANMWELALPVCQRHALQYLNRCLVIRHLVLFNGGINFPLYDTVPIGVSCEVA